MLNLKNINSFFYFWNNRLVFYTSFNSGSDAITSGSNPATIFRRYSWEYMVQIQIESPGTPESQEGVPIQGGHQREVTSPSLISSLGLVTFLVRFSKSWWLNITVFQDLSFDGHDTHVARAPKRVLKLVYEN